MAQSNITWLAYDYRALVRCSFKRMMLEAVSLVNKDSDHFLKIIITFIQEDLKCWISSITTCINEHEELSKFGQSHPTTSSTDEGTRREGSRAEKSDRGDRGSERSDKGEKMEKKSGKKK